MAISMSHGITAECGTSHLALMGEVFVQQGAAKVIRDIQQMKETNQMAPYLCDLYIGLRQASDLTSQELRLLHKRIPCDCLDDLWAIGHAAGEERGEYCEVCQKASPKSQFKVRGGCDIESYCSVGCLKKDRPAHKLMCKRLQTAIKK